MPVFSATNLSIGILVGLALGYGLWEVVHVFLLPAQKTNKNDTQIGLIRMTFLAPPEHPDEDVTQLIDLYNFTYIMNQPSCGPNVHALVLVPSAPKNREKRELIRRTWANFVELPLHKNTMPFRVIFLLGLPSTAVNQSELERENFEYDDMVQGSFMDTYENLTYKHVMALKWFLAYCSNSKILIKVDDDVFLNTPQLMIYLHNSMLHNELPQRTITTTAPRVTSISANTTDPDKILFRQRRDVLFCLRIVGERVNRSYRKKWRVSLKEYPKPTYPPHCPGFGIIYSPDIVRKLYNAAQRAKYFWIDDIHITGFLTEVLNINIIPANAYTVRCDQERPTCDRKVSDDVEKADDLEFLFSHGPDSEQMQNMWRQHLKRAWDYILSDIETRISYVDTIEKALS